MIPAKPNRWVMLWFDGWCRRAMRQQFYRLHVWGSLPPTDGRPTVFVVNHSSFWDGIVLWRLLHGRYPALRCVSDERQMREHPFFARVGCFSVDRASPRRAVESLRYAADQLTRPGAAVVLFPQGKIEHVDTRPLKFEGGVGWLIDHVPGLRVVPLAIRYEWWEEQRGEIMIDVGDFDRPPGARRDTIDALSRAIEAQLHALKQRSIGREAAKRVDRIGRRSISHWRDAWTHNRA